MLTDVAIVAAIAVAAALLLMPRVSRATLWRASVTPLASIIGSGFLILGPVLDDSYGKYAPLVMAGLCAGAYLYGAAVRFNIAMLDGDYQRSAREERLESAASWVLAFAYVISVAYYLNLFGAFGVSLTPFDNAWSARILTTAIFVLILAVGWTRGFRMLETFEYFSVTAKLAIIAGLLIGLAIFFTGKAFDGGLLFNPATRTGWGGIVEAFGLLVTVQGFETSRYLGKAYNAPTRIRSMKLAQWTATAIYMTYICMLAYIFRPSELRLSETAIIDMMAIVAPVLPFFLVAAALSAQFSAAVADTSGSGGLVAELTKKKVNERGGYAALVAAGLVLTWTADVFEIISYASRAFAAYYALQAFIAAFAAGRSGRRMLAAGFGALGVLGVVIVVFGRAVAA